MGISRANGRRERGARIFTTFVRVDALIDQQAGDAPASQGSDQLSCGAALHDRPISETLSYPADLPFEIGIVEGPREILRDQQRRIGRVSGYLVEGAALGDIEVDGEDIPLAA